LHLRRRHTGNPRERVLDQPGASRATQSLHQQLRLHAVGSARLDEALAHRGSVIGGEIGRWSLGLRGVFLAQAVVLVEAEAVDRHRGRLAAGAAEGARPLRVLEAKRAAGRDREPAMKAAGRGARGQSFVHFRGHAALFPRADGRD
jgi:hypothetical protein